MSNRYRDESLNANKNANATTNQNENERIKSSENFGTCNHNDGDTDRIKNNDEDRNNKDDGNQNDDHNNSDNKTVKNALISIRVYLSPPKKHPDTRWPPEHLLGYGVSLLNIQACRYPCHGICSFTISCEL